MSEQTQVTNSLFNVVVAVVLTVLLIGVMVIPIINAATQTTTTTSIDNEGAGWLKLGYNEGADYNFTVGFDGDDNFSVGTQTGEYDDMICYADPQRTLFISGDNWYLLTKGESPFVYKFTDMASVSNISGTLTINDGSTVIYSGASPTWAYIPDSAGMYGFFTNGGLTLEDGKPTVSVGSYAGVFAYNNTVIAPDNLGNLGLVKSGDYADGVVTWVVPDPESIDENTEETPLNANYESDSVIGYNGGNNISLRSADPTTGTQVGDLYYTFSGTYATVVGYSSTIDWATFTSIPDTVTYNGTEYTIISIGTSAFENCSNLALTSLPSGLTSIGTRAFLGCSHLALTSLPSGITSIAGFAFFGCSNLALTSLPDGVTDIGARAFYNCTRLALTSLPDGVTDIDYDAFQGCTRLALTSLPSGLTSIAQSTFAGCTNLALTSLPDGLRSISKNAFSGCSHLALTSLPSGITSIGENAFGNCSNLALTSLPSGLTSIAQSTFAGCTNLALTSLPDGVTTIGQQAFNGCTNLALTSLPDGVTRIDVNTFNRCTNLALTSLPEGVTSIGNSAFSACRNMALTSLPEGVTSIGNLAFSNCDSMNTLIVRSSPTIGNTTFTNTPIKEVLNLGETEITTTSYGLNADSVRSDIPALGYIAPVSIHNTITETDGSLTSTLMQFLPVILILALIVLVGIAIMIPKAGLGRYMDR